MATQPEVFALEKLNQAAQARLGIAAAYLTLLEWTTVNDLNAAGTSAAWLAHAVDVITVIRKLSVSLAISYYRLSRAIETGHTLGALGGPSIVTLGSLRNDFIKQVEVIDSINSQTPQSKDPDIHWLEEQLRDANSKQNTQKLDLRNTDLVSVIYDYKSKAGHDGETKISVDDFQWPQAWDKEEVDKAFRDVLRKQAVKTSTDKIKLIKGNDSLTPEEAINQIQKAHQDAGALGSATADWAGVQAGRDVISFATERDKRVKLIARGTSGDPCAFCAMLASRGFVYASNQTAGVGEEIKKYHVNCHCYPIVRWTKESQLPALSQYFKQMWYETTRGYSGQDAVNAFRRWHYKASKENQFAAFAASAA